MAFAAERAFAPVFIGLSLSACAHLPSTSSPQPPRDTYCDQEVCISRVAGKNGEITLLASSARSDELSVTLRFDLRNLSASPASKRVDHRDGAFTIGLHPGEKAEVAILRPVDPVRETRMEFIFWWNWGLATAVHKPSRPYRVPFPHPVEAKVIQGFAGATSHFDDETHAVDLAVPVGTPVVAAREGKVLEIQNGLSESGNKPCLGAGNFVLLRHPDGTLALYAHLEKGSVRVGPGQAVSAGELLARSGNTGRSSTPHLHFEVSRRVDGRKKETLPFRFAVHGKGEAAPEFGDTLVADPGH